MTIESITTRVAYKGNGVTRRFPLPFPLLAESHVEVYVTTENTKDSTVIKPLRVGYRVENIPLNEPCLVYPEDADGPALEKGRILTVVRRLPLVQQMNLENGGKLHAETLETQFDILTMQVQQLAYDLDRAVKVPPYSANVNMGVADVLARMEEFCQRAEAAALRLEKQDDLETVLTKATNIAATWAVDKNAEAGDVLVLPVYYMSGRNMLVLSVDGVLCYPAGGVAGVKGEEQGNPIAQYEELSEIDGTSNKIRLLFPLSKGSVCHALVLGNNSPPEEPFPSQTA